MEKSSSDLVHVKRSVEGPSLRCPQCGGRFGLPDEPPASVACPKCGPVAFPDLNAPARAYLLAATDAVGAPAPKGHAGGTDGRTVYELRDDDHVPLCQLAPATRDELGSAREATGVDTRGIENLLALMPQAAFSGAILGQLAGSYVLRVAPSLAGQIAAGTAKLMPAATGGVHSGVVSVARNVLIGQASFAPVTAATLGAAAAWQMLSLVVAQKHLHDIHARLDHIERNVDELKQLHEQDLYAEIKGTADHLIGYARSWEPGEDPGSPAVVARRQTITEAIMKARERHEKLAARVSIVEKRFLPNRKAEWFGKSMDTAKKELTTDIDELSRLMAALRLNALLIATANDLLRRNGEKPAYTRGVDADLEKMVARDDEWFGAILGRVDHSVMGLCAIFQRGVTESAARLRLAGRVWAGARLAARLRTELDHVVGDAREPPTLLVTLGEGRTVTSVAWVDQGVVGVPT